MMDEPYISRQSVARCLDGLLYDSKSDELTSDLHGLLVVELRLSELPAGELTRDFAVRELLSELISAAYFAVRRALELPIPRADLPRTPSEKLITEDALLRNPELLAWSLLYHRYVRTDFDLSVGQLAKLISVNERTFRRYQAYAIRLLTYRLIGLEQRARLDKKQRYLLTALPSSVPLRLFGQDARLDAIAETLRTAVPAHLLITGLSGIGKTSFAQEVMRRWILDDRLDTVFWFDQPASAQMVLDVLKTRLLPEGRRIDLGEVLLLHRVGVVLDGIDALIDDVPALLMQLSAVFVILTHQPYSANLRVNTQIVLSELDLANTVLLTRDLLHKQHSDDEADAELIARALFERVGGNPAAIRTMLAYWDYAEWDVVQTRLHEDVFGRLFETLPEAARSAWCALALTPNALPEIDADSLSLLLRHHLLERAQERGHLITGARAYIHEQAAPLVLQTLDDVIDHAVYPVAEVVLSSEFAPADLNRRFALIRRFVEEGIARGQHAVWREIIESFVRAHGVLDNETRACYGSILRRLGEWEQAEAVFLDVAAATGKQGQFRMQAVALLEWSITARYQGNYQRAADLIVQAQSITRRLKDTELLERLLLQEAQILVDAGRSTAALALLTGVSESPRRWLVLSEALLASGDHAGARRHADYLLGRLSLDLGTQASLHTVIARSFEAEGQLEAAEPHFARAMMLLEQAGDTYSLARAQTNLAALLIKRQVYVDARHLLTRAERTQVQLGDKVGLMTTRHNRSIMHRSLAS